MGSHIPVAGVIQIIQTSDLTESRDTSYYATWTVANEGLGAVGLKGSAVRHIGEANATPLTSSFRKSSPSLGTSVSRFLDLIQMKYL